MKQSSFSDTIRALRKKAGYTQEEVSRELNIQRQTYCNYENALRTPPLEIIIALADLYHVSVDHLVCGSDPAREKDSRTDSAKDKLYAGFSSLSEAAQKEVLDFIHFKKLFPD